MKRRVLKSIGFTYLGLIYFFIYAPILVLIIYSFNHTDYSLLWHGFTLSWYQALLQNMDLWQALQHSVIVGIAASTLATLLGTLGALCFYRYKFFGKQTLFAIIFMMVVIPDILLGVCLLILYSALKIPLGFFSLWLAHVTMCLPFALIMIYSRLATFDSYMLMAAKDLGASEWQTFRYVVLPNIWTAVIGAWLLSFTLSFDDVVISYFVSGPGYTILPLQIYSMVRVGMKPALNALCAIIFLFTLIIVVISQWLLKDKS